MSSSYNVWMSLSITQAADELRQGNLVAFPTETVYGLGVDARSAIALEKLYALKGRPTDHPVIVHLAEAEQLNDWAINIPKTAWVLANAFWPGPLTLILPRASHVLDAVTGGQSTVGLRVPSHPIAQALLQAFGGGLAAPSANRFGGISPTKAEHVREDFSEKELPWLLDGGNCTVGVESTIVTFKDGKPIVLRPGMITAAQIEAACQTHSSQVNKPVKDSILNSEEQATFKNEPVTFDQTPDDIRAPGLLTKHYAPDTKLYLVPGFRLLTTVEARLSAMASLEMKRTESGADFSKKATPTRFGVLARKTKPSELGLFGQQLHWVQAADDAKTYASELYAHLHTLDSLKLDVLLIESVPESGEWAAIADRLSRASAKS